MLHGDQSLITMVTIAFGHRGSHWMKPSTCIPAASHLTAILKQQVFASIAILHETSSKFIEHTMIYCLATTGLSWLSMNGDSWQVLKVFDYQL